MSDLISNFIDSGSLSADFGAIIAISIWKFQGGIAQAHGTRKTRRRLYTLETSGFGLNKSEVRFPLTALIFDLDGTLTDSKPGILGCLQKVLDSRRLDGRGPLDRFIGPPVEEWTVELLPGGSREDHAALAREYRACYDCEGWMNNAVFAGVEEVLMQLHKRVPNLFVCTSKQQHAAIRILDFFGIAKFFTAIYGDRIDYSSHSKVDLVAKLLREQELDTNSTWMIGDRIHDIHAAHANGIRCLAAAWGYGNAAEHKTADAIAASPRDLVVLLCQECLPKIAEPEDAIPQ